MAYMESEFTPFQMRTMGRGFGKTRGHNTTGAVVDEPYRERAAARKRSRNRGIARLYRRRYEFPSESRDSIRVGHQPAVCPHREIIHLERPHPRYGKAQPYFVPREVAIEPEGHDCFAELAQ